MSSRGGKLRSSGGQSCGRRVILRMEPPGPGIHSCNLGGEASAVLEGELVATTGVEPCAASNGEVLGALPHPKVSANVKPTCSISRRVERACIGKLISR